MYVRKRLKRTRKLSTKDFTYNSGIALTYKGRNIDTVVKLDAFKNFRKVTIKFSHRFCTANILYSLKSRRLDVSGAKQ